MDKPFVVKVLVAVEFRGVPMWSETNVALPVSDASERLRNIVEVEAGRQFISLLSSIDRVQEAEPRG